MNSSETKIQQKSSIEILHGTKSKQNVSIANNSSERSSLENSINESNTGDNSDTAQPSNTSPIETVFEKLTMQIETKPSSAHSGLILNDSKPKSKVDIPPIEFEVKDRTSSLVTINNPEVTELTVSKPICPLTDSSSGKILKKRDNSSSVFPIGCMGCKDDELSSMVNSPRRFLDAKEASNDPVGHMESTPRKRLSSAKIDARNPLTGEGLEKTEARRQTSKRKDGNPLLGTGYDDKPKATQSKCRVPPGGFSQGLW